MDRDAGSYRALGQEIKLQGGEDPTAMEIRPSGIVLTSAQNLVILTREGEVKQQVYHPAPQLPGLLRALHAVNAVRESGSRAAVSTFDLNGDVVASIQAGELLFAVANADGQVSHEERLEITYLADYLSQ